MMRLSLRFLCILFLCAAAAGSGWGRPADGVRLDALLRAHYGLDADTPLTAVSVAPESALDRAAFTPPRYRKALPAKRLRPGPRLAEKKRAGELLADVWITLDDPGFDRSLLTRRRVEIRTDLGSVLTAFCPVPGLLPVSQLPGVRCVEAAHRCYERLDLSVPAAQVPGVWQALQGMGRLRGEGVVVGVIDGGFYWRHEDFRKPDLTTRFLSIWDQRDAAGPHPAGFSYGTEWTAADINAAVPRHQDPGGHGTHVLGIAAGDGSATGNAQPADRFVGVAPEADLIGVTYNFHPGDDVPIRDTEVADAMSYILNRAAGRPVAMNMSFGMHWGPHDGTFVLDRAVDEFLGPGRTGRAVAVSAGNEGGDLFHAAAVIAAPEGDNYTYLALRQNPYRAIPWIDCEFWYPAAASVSARVWVPRGGQQSPVVTDWVPTGQRGDFTINEGAYSGLRVFVDSRESPYPQNTALNRTWVEVIDPSQQLDLSQAVFFIDLQGTGVAFETWVSSESGVYLLRNDQNPDPWQVPGDSEMTVITPASARKAVCVAAYNTKNQYVDVDGNTRQLEGTNIGEIAEFSSRGPLRDGTRKPDVAAPGNVVLAAYSADENLEGDPETRIYIERDGVHVRKQGTSMAAPHVTGVLALLLQKNPNLDSEQLKNALLSTALDRGAPGWDKFWGLGQMDALAAFNSIAAGPAVTPGDVNDDGAVDAADAILVARHLAGLALLAGDPLDAADADENGTVSQADIDWILEKKVGLR